MFKPNDVGGAMTTPEPGRRTVVVVVDSAGVVRGVTKPQIIRWPHWQEAAPVAEIVPGSVVLRLLEVEPPAAGHDEWAVTYLVECDEPIERPLLPWSGSVEPHPLRMPWAEVNGPGHDLEWVRSVVEVTGAPTMHRTWNLSSIWSIPSSDGTVWLKCVPPFFEHEASVLDYLQHHAVPRLLAANGHRMLLAAMPGEDGYEASESEQDEMVRSLVDIQIRAAQDVDALVELGVPDLRAHGLIRELSALVERLAPDNATLNELVRQLPERLAIVAESGVPDTLVHGDAHAGNCRRGIDPPIWFDWGDSYVGNALFDLAPMNAMRPAVQERWVDLWAEWATGSDPRTAWKALEPVARLRSAWVYQRFLDNIEPSERVYHRDDVQNMLVAAEAAMTG